MAALAQPEIRVRIDADELAQAKRVAQTIGLPLNDAVKVLVRNHRGGGHAIRDAPTGQRQPQADGRTVDADSWFVAPGFGIDIRYLEGVATVRAPRKGRG